MKNHAVIENGVVTNIIVWDGEDAFAELELVETGDLEVGIGFTWSDGKFTAPPLSAEERSAQAAENKRYLIDAANTHIADRQWPSRLALGRLSEEERKQFNAWLDYIDVLSEINPESSSPVKWPDIPK